MPNRPNHADAYYCRGNSRKALNDFAAAIADYTVAINLRPRFANAWVNRGNASLAAGERDRALADFQQALTIEPRNGYALSALRKTFPDAYAQVAQEPVLEKGQTPPHVRIRVPPVYPLLLRRAGITGEALVEFIVTANGDVVQATAIRATHPGFGQAAAEAIKQWKFEPGRVNGRPVHTRMQQGMKFDLEEPAPTKEVASERST